MKQTIGIILIILGGFLAFTGYQKMDENKASVKIGGLELSAENNDNTPMVYLIGGVAIAAFGIYMLGRKN